MPELLTLWSEIARQLSAAPRDVVIGAIADVQHGAIARWQLIALGFTGGAISRRIESHLLRPVHRGVYAVGHRNLSRRGHAMAAVLACGRGAFLSHNSAAVERDLRRVGQSKFDVTVPAGRRPRPPGIRLHTTRTLHREDVSLVDGIPVASVARTLIDFARVLSEQKLKDVVEQAHRLQVFDLLTIDRAIARAPNRRGIAKLRAVMAAYRPPPFTRSKIEREVHDELAKRPELPPHLMNQKVGDVEVDVWFPGSRFAVQIDTPDYHDSPNKFEEDRSDDIKLDLLGCRHIRITGKRWRNERQRVLWEIETLSRLPPPVGALMPGPSAR
jgi:hypothetical protein